VSCHISKVQPDDQCSGIFASHKCRTAHSFPCHNLNPSRQLESETTKQEVTETFYLCLFVSYGYFRRVEKLLVNYNKFIIS